MKGMQNVTIAGKSAQELRIAGDVLMMSVVPFCESVISAVGEWYQANKGNQFIQANLERLVRYRPEGVPPIFVNVPVIG